jgi:NAD(P)-dependent dehydrogenase (short-subunit alcohol dehydrogenase family)
VLINNEYPVTLAPTETAQADDIQEFFNRHVCGALRIFQTILPTMKKNKSGLLINVNSSINYLAMPFVIALAMAKAGLEILTESLLREVSRFGIEGVSLWTGTYPLELKPGEKPALLPGLTESNKNARQQAQFLAAFVAELVNLPAGKRLARYNLNPELDQAEIQFAEAGKLAAKAWRETCGITI